MSTHVARSCHLRLALPLRLFAAAAISVAGACSGDPTAPPDPLGASEIASVEVTPNPASVVTGQILQLTVVTKAANGTTLTGRPVTWTTSDEAVAGVNATGLVSGVAPGTATITATSEGVNGTATVTVTPGVPPPPVPGFTATILADVTLSGHVYRPSAGGDFVSPRHLTGDGTDNGTARSLFSFDLSSLPRNAIIVSASLRLYQGGGSGTPYADLGPLLVDHMDLGGALDGSDFDAPALADNIGVLGTQDGTGPRSLDVTLQVMSDRGATRMRSEFRARFTSDTDGDNQIDSAAFSDVAIAAPGNEPQLEVVYRLP